MRLAALLSSLCACAPRHGSGGAAAPSALGGGDLTNLRDELNQAAQARTREAWARWTGAAVTPAPSPIITGGTIAELSAAIAQASGDERRALVYLRAFAVGELLRRATAAIDERAAALGGARVQAGDLDVRYDELWPTLARIAESATRRALVAASAPTAQALAELADERDEMVAATARGLGLLTARDLAAVLNGADVAASEARARYVLLASRPLVTAGVSRLTAAEPGLVPSALAYSDLPRLLARTEELAPQRLLPLVRSTAADLDFDLGRLPVTIDVAPSGGKGARAACFPIRVPDDVRVSMKPAGVFDDVPVLLHELGHALQLASTRTPLRELRTLGSGGSAEAFAFLFEGLAADPLWLEDHALVEAAGEDAGTRAWVRRLFVTRRYAAKLLAELEAFGAPREERRRVWRARLEGAYGVSLDDAALGHLRADVDQPFYSAAYLDGALLAAELELVLGRDFGERWWSTDGAGALLARVFADAQAHTPDELASTLVGAPLTGATLVTLSAKRALAGGVRP